jgi:hypothetical protein
MYTYIFFFAYGENFTLHVAAPRLIIILYVHADRVRPPAETRLEESQS